LLLAALFVAGRIPLLVFPASLLFMAPRVLLLLVFASVAAAVVPGGLRFAPRSLRFAGLTALLFMVRRTVFGVPRTLFSAPRILPFMAPGTLPVAPGNLLFMTRVILRFVVSGVVRFMVRWALSVLFCGSPATIDSKLVDRAARVRADRLAVR
jgi:hypothetical protein